MADVNKNLWAPWRMDYIRSLSEEGQDYACFLCHYWRNPEHDRSNHVIWRTGSAFACMNRFPYTNGHLLVAAGAHKADFAELTESEMIEMASAIRDGVGLLRKLLNPQGFNIGYNLGLCAGAGLPNHLHAHVVPRWSGDTNYMAVLGDIRVVPQALDMLYNQLAEAAGQQGLRG